MSFRHSLRPGTYLWSRTAHRAALLMVLIFVGVGCASEPAETSASTRAPAASTNQLEADRPVAEAVASTPTVVALPTASVAATAVPTPEPITTATSTPLVIPTPAVEKNQPVFRQARVDGDTRSAPTLIGVQDDLTTVSGEVSAFTDQVDVYAVARSDAAQELAINWSCTRYAAEDGRPVRLLIEQDGTTVSELRCAGSGVDGSTRVPIVANGALLMIVDSRLVEGQTGANLFAAYEISVRSVTAGDGEAAAETSDAMPTPTPTPPPTPATTTQIEATPTPTAGAEPGPTPTTTADAEPTPTASAEPEPTPTSGVIVTQPAPVDDEAVGDDALDDVDEPVIGNGRTAPEDGDSRSAPQRPEDAGFLVGSVSSPGGDQADWSSFGVGSEDPTEIFAGVVCENFTSADGTGTLTVTIYEQTAPKVTLTCTPGALEDFAPLTLTAGQTYFIEASFSGTGYTDWFFQAGDDD